MVTFSLSLPPSNRQGQVDPVLAADHNDTVIAVDSLSSQAAAEITALHGQLAQLVTDDDPRLSNPRTPTAHGHPVSDLNTYGVADGTTFLRGDGQWAQPPATGGVTDHSNLTGLTTGDPHTQYLTPERGDMRYAPDVHGHAQGDVDGLESALTDLQGAVSQLQAAVGVTVSTTAPADTTTAWLDPTEEA